MNIGRAAGTVVATKRADGIAAPKYLIVELCNERLEPGKRSLIALDPMGAGPGEIVLVSQGSSARQTESTNKKAVDAVVVAIVDALEERGKATYRK